ncbi:MAG: helix-turn-helix domain-containing protein [Granulosicoccus sp.]
MHDNLRYRMAIEYLTARKVSVSQVAYLVGFSEPSSFVRAFRRWTGTTPRQFQTENTAVQVNV